MKSFINWLGMAAISLTLGISPAGGAARPDPVAQARVVKLTGSATFTDATGRSGPVQPGMMLGEGTTITTEIGSGVVLDFGASGQIINVKDNSRLTIESLKLRNTGADLVGETTLNLEQGRILGNVKKLSKESRFEVKTARGVAGIRGTSFEIYAVGIYRCITGQIVVTISNLSNPKEAPRAFTVTQGNSVNAGGDTVPSVVPIPPRDLQSLINQMKDLPKLVGGGLVRGDGRPGLPPEVKAMIDKALNGPKDLMPDPEYRAQNDVGRQADVVARIARAAAVNAGENNPVKLDALTQNAAAAFVAGYRASPTNPQLAGTAAAIAAAGAVLSNEEQQTIVRVAARAAENPEAYFREAREIRYVQIVLPPLSPLIGNVFFPLGPE